MAYLCELREKGGDAEVVYDGTADAMMLVSDRYAATFINFREAANALGQQMRGNAIRRKR